MSVNLSICLNQTIYFLKMLVHRFVWLRCIFKWKLCKRIKVENILYFIPTCYKALCLEFNYCWHPTEGHGEGTNTVQKPHIQLWNYEDLSFIQLLGIDQFETSLKALAFSDLYQDFVYLAAVDTEQSPNLRVWKGFQDNEEEPEFVGNVKAYSDAVENVYFYPEPSNIMLTIGKSHVTMWNIG